MDGHWVDEDDGLTFPVTHPAAGKVLDFVPSLGKPRRSAPRLPLSAVWRRPESAGKGLYTAWRRTGN